MGRAGGFACLAGSVIGAALIPIFLRYFTDVLDAWTVNGVRFLVAAISWLPFLLVRDRAPAPPVVSPTPRSRSVWRDAVVPSLLNAGAQALFALGPYYLSASAVGFLARLSFVFTIVFGFAVLEEERLLAGSRAFWIGTVMSLFGVVLMYFDGFKNGGNFSIGALTATASAMGVGAFTVAVRRCMGSYSARKSFSVISLYTSSILVLVAIFVGDGARLLQLSLHHWFLLVISALIGIAFGHVMLYQSIQYFGAVITSGVQLVTPFATYLFASLIFGERMTPSEWIGGILLVCSGALLVAADYRRRAPPLTNTRLPAPEDRANRMHKG